MRANVRNWELRCFGSAVALLLLAGTVWAAEGRAKIGTYDPAAQNVEMFSAIEKGDIAVRLIPKDSTQCKVLIENKTNKPLNVKLPESFAGVPALGQIGGGGRSTRSSGRNGGGQNQSMGGGMGGMGGGGMGGGGMGGGGGFFNVPPEVVGKFDVTTVCLEHGKAEPRAAIPYDIKPLESFTSKPGVRELCELLGNGQTSQRAAQVAAWHLNNGMSLQELAAKRIRHANGTSEPYFTAEEMQSGMNLVAMAVRLSEERQKQEPSTTATPAPASSQTQ